MPMTSEQTNAFKAGSGSLDVNIFHLLCIGALLAFLFLWAAWALSDVWTGWSNTKVRDAALGRFAVRTVLLLLVCIWMFAS
ncbi:TIGR03758 family integrating conjugative element protein [Yersinia alsatica]|jgi:integrating conjugative element protein (TIGR03758 family)|uniref:TIGR03758 family integrating conjugative element protein n=1 Tax=Yersiniaceae TaxID=1903411 RepID=UPI0005DC6FA6|nr:MULTISPECIES: TIGR03758 family integrating conjugative element protein [Yersiniaceae]MCI1897024.1 TIGR03758 family integrating conjugative element protein [Enterobacter sp.]MDF8321012.1 TIGR03758 family integrating conjugative element protein [Serratia nevei]HDU5040916.1 TIGR03758 family integrating conjugative element protein [Klebsiella aerogenes]EKN3970911.1 TIGR03758 family integrating conjugative element protein [Yersinia enterocolitica]EKN4088402.1 TIGR03758 family integrating conjuga